MPESLYHLIDKAIIYSGFDITEVVCGMAKGADLLGKKWGEDHGIPVKEFPADWNKYKRAAGPIRNKEMEQYGDGLIVFIYPNSRGSVNMLNLIKKAKKPFLLVGLGDLNITEIYIRSSDG